MATINGNWWDETLEGTSKDDTIRGDGGKDYIVGLDGDDTIFGDDGDDTIHGGDGADELDGGLANDRLFGGAGNDELSGGVNDDEISGGDGDDVILDLWGVDEISGGAGNDEITVEGGDWFRYDHVDGGSGNDVLQLSGQHIIANGGSGNDTIFTSLSRETIIAGGSGSDRFVVTGFAYGAGQPAEIHGGDLDVDTAMIFGVETITSVETKGDTAVDTLDLSDAGNLQYPGLGYIVDLSEGVMTNYDTWNGVKTYAYVSGIENVVGSMDNDAIYGNTSANNLSGEGGDDVVVGDEGNDTLDGGDGADDLGGGEHNDVLYGRAGADELSGGSGSDSLFGGTEDDILEGGSGVDVLNGEAGNDTLDGGTNGDTVNGGAGNDTVRGGAGQDIVYGDFYGDAVAADTLTGGADADRFVFLDVAKSVQTVTAGNGITFRYYGAIVDKITDFDTQGADHDVVDLATIIRERTDFHETHAAGAGAQDAFEDGYIYFAATSTGMRVMVDLNGSIDGTHTDSANNFAVADLQGIAMADVQNRPDLFLV